MGEMGNEKQYFEEVAMFFLFPPNGKFRFFFLISFSLLNLFYIIKTFNLKFKLQQNIIYLNTQLFMQNFVGHFKILKLKNILQNKKSDS